MKFEKNLLIIIPARGGSKRIPYKNIIPICGQPMIYWPLNELTKGFKLEEILISTDDQKIATVVEKLGIKISFIRPKNLSDDFTGTMPVATHALNWYEKNVKKTDFVLIVYPTALMLDIQNIFKAIQILKFDKNCDLVMSVTDYPSPIQRSLFLDKNGYGQMFYPKFYQTRSQDLTTSYHDAGQFYIWKSKSLKEKKTIVNSNVKLFKIHRNFVIDIDTLEDIEIAETKLKMFKINK